MCKLCLIQAMTTATASTSGGQGDSIDKYSVDWYWNAPPPLHDFLEIISFIFKEPLFSRILGPWSFRNTPAVAKLLLITWHSCFSMAKLDNGRLISKQCYHRTATLPVCKKVNSTFFKRDVYRGLLKSQSVGSRWNFYLKEYQLHWLPAVFWRNVRQAVSIEPKTAMEFHTRHHGKLHLYIYRREQYKICFNIRCRNRTRIGSLC